MQRLRNRHILCEEDVVTPAQLLEEFPLSEKARLTVSDARTSIIDILNGIDNRIMIMVGPCSIHSTTEAVAYAKKLRELVSKVNDRILILMRVYFEKPRTRLGWKGLISDPDLDGTNDYNKGLRTARKLLLEVNNLGIPAVTEFLGPIVPQYISDLISTGTIGARTTESQTHREMASGLSMPVGYKNGTDGGIAVALDALVSAGGEHSFLGINMAGQSKIMRTSGNPYGYLMLRGGKGITNFDSIAVTNVLKEIEKQKLSYKIVEDCSHGNSLKDHTNQGKVFKTVINQIVVGQREIIGLMLESNLKSGRQDFIVGKKPKYGVSLTDACIGWEETQTLILEAYNQLS